jgi:hypothetical protein
MSARSEDDAASRRGLGVPLLILGVALTATGINQLRYLPHEWKEREDLIARRTSETTAHSVRCSRCRNGQFMDVLVDRTWCTVAHVASCPCSTEGVGSCVPAPCEAEVHVAYDPEDPSNCYPGKQNAPDRFPDLALHGGVLMAGASLSLVAGRLLMRSRDRRGA